MNSSAVSRAANPSALTTLPYFTSPISPSPLSWSVFSLSSSALRYRIFSYSILIIFAELFFQTISSKCSHHGRCYTTRFMSSHSLLYHIAPASVLNNFLEDFWSVSMRQLEPRFSCPISSNLRTDLLQEADINVFIFCGVKQSLE